MAAIGALGQVLIPETDQLSEKGLQESPKVGVIRSFLVLKTGRLGINHELRNEASIPRMDAKSLAKTNKAAAT